MVVLALRILRPFIHFVKFFVSLVTAIYLLYPPELVFKHPCTKVAYKNDSMNMLQQMTCRMPIFNMETSKEEITNALRLPRGTVLSEQLFNVGKCKVAMKKVGANDNACCLCLGYWLLFTCGMFVAASCFLSLVDLILALVVRRYLWSLKEWQRTKRCSKIVMSLFLVVAYVTVRHIDTLSENLRYTLPNSVYKGEYYETPLFWWWVTILCATQISLCVMELWFLRYVHTKGYVVVPPKVQDSPKQCVVILQIDNTPLKLPSQEERNEQPVACLVASPIRPLVSTTPKSFTCSSSSSRLESASEFHSSRASEIATLVASPLPGKTAENSPVSRPSDIQLPAV